MRLTRRLHAAALAAGLAALPVLVPPAWAWDSLKFRLLGEIVHPTHSYLTEFAIDQNTPAFPELAQFRAIIVEGANSELHELPVEGSAYGIDLDAARRTHLGVNAGSDDVAGWWADAQAAYAAGDREQAWYIAGVILHMVQDMGVPAHANGVYHQGTLEEFDNFEAMAFQRWDPDWNRIDRTDPGYATPADYYLFSQNWAATDAPDYRDPDSFATTWLTASRAEEQLVRDRQARTAAVSAWTLRAVATGFAGM